MEEVLLKYLRGDLTEPEEAQLQQWLQASSGNRRLLEQLTNEQWVSAQLQQFDDYDVEENWEKLQSFFPASGVGTPPINKSRLWRRIAVAASLILALGAGVYFAFFQRMQKQDAIVETKATDVKAPTSNQARITLADGQTVDLDSMPNGQLAVQGNIKLVKLANGQIVYLPAEAQLPSYDYGSQGAKAGGSRGKAGLAYYNTLTNPRGSKVIDMQLADGSRVWLNAGSSVTYPVVFTGGNRQVSITGEAYFEVTDDKTKPFYVTKGSMQVQVLGTKFNVNAYNDETDIKVTLLSGAVKVSNGQNTLTIRPDQQAVVAKEGISLNTKVATEQVMAWKNGRFEFGQSTSLESILREVSRWYDVEIVYNDKIDQHFGGNISRQVSVSEVLEKFELTGRVRFDIRGKKIFVSK